MIQWCDWWKCHILKSEPFFLPISIFIDLNSSSPWAVQDSQFPKEHHEFSSPWWYQSPWPFFLLIHTFQFRKCHGKNKSMQSAEAGGWKARSEGEKLPVQVRTYLCRTLKSAIYLCCLLLRDLYERHSIALWWALNHTSTWNKLYQSLSEQKYYNHQPSSVLRHFVWSFNCMFLFQDNATYKIFWFNLPFMQLSSPNSLVHTP